MTVSIHSHDSEIETTVLLEQVILIDSFFCIPDTQQSENFIIKGLVSRVRTVWL